MQSKTNFNLALILLCFMCFVLNANTLQAQAEETLTIDIKMTDEEGNTSVKKIVKKGDEIKDIDISKLVQVEVADFKGKVEVNVDMQSTDINNIDEIAETLDIEDMETDDTRTTKKEKRRIFIEGGSDEVKEIEVEDVKIKIDGDKVFIDGEEVKEGEIDGKKIVIVEMDEDMDEAEMQSILDDMDIDMDDIMGGKKNNDTNIKKEVRKEIRIIKKDGNTTTEENIWIDKDGETHHLKKHKGAHHKHNHNKVRLGVMIEDTDNANGAVIVDVNKGSAAAKAGLIEGDIITKFHKTKITNADTLIEAVSKQACGDKVKIQFTRDGKKEKTSTKL